MTAENFCYWLQGYFELYGPKTLDEKETRVVWDHLNLVFNKVTSPKTPIPIRAYDENGQPLRIWPVFNPDAETSPSSLYPESLREWNKNQPDPKKKLIC